MDGRGSPEAPRALSLDLDATLLDGSGLQGTIFATCAMLADVLPDVGAERIREANAAAWEVYWGEVERPWELGLVTGASVTLEAWRRTLRDCGCRDAMLVERAADYHRQLIRESHRLFDDVYAFLEWAKAARIPLALVTNGASDTQREKLEVLGIEGYFDTIVVSGEIGVAKPDPSLFVEALGRLGLEPNMTWHVGDSLSKDVGGAAAAGMTTVWLNRNGVDRSTVTAVPHLEIRSLSALTTLIESDFESE